MRKILPLPRYRPIFGLLGFAAFQKPSWDALADIKQKKNPIPFRRCFKRFRICREMFQLPWR
jgi:hypothetical protein